MSARNILPFLRLLAARPDLLRGLRTQSKDEVLTAAARMRLPFTSDEFDTVVWDLEERLAERRDESFDDTFSLWPVMWGQFYLEYLVNYLLPSLGATGLATEGAVR